MLNHIIESVIIRMPAAIDHWFRIAWQGLQLGKGRSLPVGRTEQNGNHMRLSTFMSLHGSLHFFAVTVFRGHEVWADKEQNNMGRVEMLVNFLFPFHACIDIRITPDGVETLPLQ